MGRMTSHEMENNPDMFQTTNQVIFMLTHLEMVNAIFLSV
jgi:hypothetical protein